MSSSSKRVLALARHEYRAAVRSRVLISLITILVVVTVASVYVASVEYSSQLADYQAYRAAAKAGGLVRIAPSPLALLSLMRGAMEYIEIIGAIIAITLGYLSVSRERVNRTLPLIRSRPVTSGERATGTLLGALAIIATLIVVTAVAAVLCLGLVGHDWPSSGQAVKLLLAYVASILYMGAFYCLGAVCAARSRVAANGLMVALGIWLIVVLIIPQIGDTLDPDNQVPGGLFAALTLDKPQELKVLAHFGTYESVRNGIEESSFEKHFERFSFAMIDVKVQDRGLSLGELLQAKKNDIAWMFLYVLVLFVALFRTFHRQPAISQGEQP